MKNTLFFFILSFVSLSLSAQDLEAGKNYFEEANKSYAEADYQKALELYTKAENQLQGAELYYNLGNTYFKLNQIPNSILYYERALKYDPASSDIRYNLEQANNLIADQIESLPVSKLNIWWKEFKYGPGEDFWAIIAVGLMLSGVILMTVYFLGRNLGIRRFGFFGGLILMALSLGALAVSLDARNHLEYSHSAIVFAEKVEVKSSPTSDGTQVFVLHEGSKVNLLNKEGDWYEISISSGDKGWMKAGDLKEI